MKKSILTLILLFVVILSSCATQTDEEKLNEEFEKSEWICSSLICTYYLSKPYVGTYRYYPSLKILDIDFTFIGTFHNNFFIGSIELDTGKGNMTHTVTTYKLETTKFTNNLYVDWDDDKQRTCEGGFCIYVGELYKAFRTLNEVFNDAGIDIEKYFNT